LIFAVAAYLAAVRGLLYLVGFVGGWVVPRTVDDGVAGGVATAVVVDLGLLLLFVVPHSLMARAGFKRWLAAKGWPAALERSLYCAVAGGTLAVMFWLWRPIPRAVWEVGPKWARTLVLGVGIGGWLLAAVSVLFLRNTRLFGLRQGWRWARDRGADEPLLVKRGPYAVVRHPVYFGFLVGMWAAPTMSGGRLLLAAASTAYVLVAWRWEERELAARYGEGYERYSGRVGAWWPRFH